VFPFAIIFPKSDFSAIAIGCFLPHYFIVDENETGIFLFMGKDDRINRKQNSAEPPSWRSSFDCYTSRRPQRRKNDQDELCL
jgi:hypothetical protein